MKNTKDYKKVTIKERATMACSWIETNTNYSIQSWKNTNNR